MVRRREKIERSRPKTKKEPKSRLKKEIIVEPRTDGQAVYIDLIKSKEIIICNGLAGSGKTVCAAGMALKLLQAHPNKYKQIIMVRPAVTVSGEDLGYLPGDIEDKMRPFMLPIMNSFKVFIQNSDVISMIELGIIEIYTIAHMRGSTFNNCIIIFDEAQNSTLSQMKMVVTRIGFNTKLIIEGDVSQSDLPSSVPCNGLGDAMIRFKDIEGVGVCSLGAKDIVRSPILSRIIETYD